MKQYLLLSNLKRPWEVRSELAVSMVDIAKVSAIPPDSVRVDLLDGLDFANENDRDRIVRLMMQGLSTCGESDAMGGLFTDTSSGG